MVDVVVPSFAAGCVSRILKDKRTRASTRTGRRGAAGEGIGATGCVQILCCLLKFGVGSIVDEDRLSVLYVFFSSKAPKLVWYSRRD